MIKNLFHFHVSELGRCLKNLDVVIVHYQTIVLLSLRFWLEGVLKKLSDLANGLFCKNVGPETYTILVVRKRQHNKIMSVIFDEALELKYVKFLATHLRVNWNMVELPFFIHELNDLFPMVSIAAAVAELQLLLELAALLGGVGHGLHEIATHCSFFILDDLDILSVDVAG